MTRSTHPRTIATRRAATPAGRLLLLAVTLVAIIAALSVAGHTLPAPPVEIHLGAWHLNGWGPWLQRLGPAGALLAVIRLLALVAACYLLAVVTLELLVLVTGLRPIASAARFVAAPWARRLTRGLAGLGVATSITAATLTTAGLGAPAGALTASAGQVVRDVRPATAADPAPIMRRLDADPSTTSGSNGSAGAPTMRRLDPDPTDPTSTVPMITAPATTSPSAVPDSPRRTRPRPTPPPQVVPLPERATLDPTDRRAAPPPGRSLSATISGGWPPTPSPRPGGERRRMPRSIATSGG
jgi:hypothetical protein